MENARRFAVNRPARRFLPPVSPLLTSRRAVDLCRVGNCACRCV